MKAHHSCPVQATINVLSGKWKVQAVWRLSFGPLRFLNSAISCEASVRKFSLPNSANWKEMAS
jgi:hypothetical protein